MVAEAALWHYAVAGVLLVAQGVDFALRWLWDLLLYCLAYPKWL
jgi:hypothetical protein